MPLVQKAKRSKLARRIACVLGSKRLWNFGALAERAAMKTTIGARSAELFDKQGEELAAELKTKISPGSIVLDLGCGIGRPEKFLSSFCKELHGVDISIAMLRLAKMRHKNFSNIYFHKIRGRSYPYLAILVLISSFQRQSFIT